MTTTSIRVREDLREPLEATAARLRRPKGWIINEALSEYLEREAEHQRLLGDIQEGLDAAKDGQVVDGDEVFAWLSSRGTDDELPMPLTDAEKAALESADRKIAGS